MRAKDLADPPFEQTIVQSLTCYFQENWGTSGSRATEWDAMKSILQGVCIKTSHGGRQQLEKDIHTLENTSGRIEQELPTRHNRLGDWTETRKQLLDAWIRLEKYLYMAHRQHLHSGGDKTGAMLARLVRRETLHTPIFSITDTRGQTVYSQEAIHDIFHFHLCTCYAPPPTIHVSDIDAYLTRLTLPVLSSEPRKTLDHPRTKEQLASVIRLLKTSKTPGNGGFPAEFYCKYANILAETP
ncbi:hypothetical protein NDU88_004324 [Pleurodeles waltl]|uniref:Uncharacterized protein n=1 Tax=Pleurodeles waltl TaxID=8319 RepID=A0AAV7QI27_PLEWA|nr:hypothetical protein NDU88_004324 [Pleurodeles waltl]